MFRPQVRGWRTRSCTLIGAIAASLAVAACGGGARQDANEPNGKFPVQVSTATWQLKQRLAQHTRLTITVRNAGNKVIPNIAVTICNVTCNYSPHQPPGVGTSVAAFAEYLNMPYLANHSRPVWVVDQPPGFCGYSCLNGGPGGAVTAYSNTWALGALAPGHSATFQWGLTAVEPGRHVVAYQIAAGLNGKARAVTSTGTVPSGIFPVFVTPEPQKSYVTTSGKVVKIG